MCVNFLSCYYKMSDIHNLKGEKIYLAHSSKGFSPPGTESMVEQSHRGRQKAERGRDKDVPTMVFLQSLSPTSKTSDITWRPSIYHMPVSDLRFQLQPEKCLRNARENSETFSSSIRYHQHQVYVGPQKPRDRNPSAQFIWEMMPQDTSEQRCISQKMAVGGVQKSGTVQDLISGSLSCRLEEEVIHKRPAAGRSYFLSILVCIQ